MDKPTSAAALRPAMQCSLGSAGAFLCAALGLALILGTTPADHIDRIDSSERGVALPAPIRLTSLAAGDAIADDDDAADWRCRVVCAL